MRPGEHGCCRFPEMADRERTAVAFMLSALGRNDKIVCYSDRDDLQPLVSRLQGLDACIRPAMARGQFEVRRADEAFLPDGRFEPERMVAMIREAHDGAVENGYSGLSLAAEAPVALCELAGLDLAPYEARLDGERRRLVAGSYSLLCEYDYARFGPGVLSGVVDAHDVDASPELAAIGRTGDLAAARDRRSDALRLAGELDFASAEAVLEVLDAHFHGPLRLDLADLTYVDVAGLRALRRSGQPLTITAISDAVRRLLALLAWDTDPAIEVLEPV